jgi:alpha-D-xyloside xylohydrolase
MNLTLFLGCCWHSLQKGIKIDDTYKTYVRGSELDVFIMNGTRHYIAQVWPGATKMPDFLHPNAQK